MLAWFNSPLDGTIIQLDATENVIDSRSASVSTSQVISGANPSDNYFAGKRSFSIAGVITGFKLREGLLSPKEYTSAIDEIMDSQQPFNFFCTDDGVLRPEKDCVITDRVFTRDGSNLDGVGVTLTLQALDIVQSAEKDAFVPVEKEGGGSQLKSTDEGGDGGTTSLSEEEAEKNRKTFFNWSLSTVRNTNGG